MWRFGLRLGEAGLRRALCGRCCAWCRELGARAMELEVREGNRGRRLGLYSGLGFGVVGRRRGYYRDPAEDAVLMRMELGGSNGQ